MSNTHSTSGSNGQEQGEPSTHEGLEVEWVPIDQVFGNPSNPRINEAAVDPVAASLKRFGWRQPVVAKRSGEVIAGNTRLKAATKLGMEQVPVVWFDGPDIEATAYAIADNRTHEFSEWDEPALAKLLEELRAEDAFDGVGYTVLGHGCQLFPTQPLAGRRVPLRAVLQRHAVAHRSVRVDGARAEARPGERINDPPASPGTGHGHPRCRPSCVP